MLDATLYRDEERAAKRQAPNWRIPQTHNLDMFEKSGFPVRVHSLADIRQLIDTMQEGRFEAYQKELGGLDEEDAELFIDACQSLVRFQQTHFPHHPPLLALDTLMAMFASYKKITSLKPNFSTILEVGPGCGYLSLFLKHWAQLETYVLTESCESFYLLQHYLNSYLYGPQFAQTIGKDSTANFFVRDESPLSECLGGPPRFPSHDTIVHQYPWWKLGELAANHSNFDLAVSNANFLEFTTEALRDYFGLFKKVLAPDGLIVCQCFGFESVERNREYLLEELKQAGVAPLFINWGGHPKARGFWKDHCDEECDFILENDERRFTVANGVFVTEKHPLFKLCSKDANFTIHTVQNAQPLKAFFNESDTGRIISKESAAQRVISKT